MTHDAQIEAKVAEARFMTESKPVEQPLTEQADLCQRGVRFEGHRLMAPISLRVIATLA